MASYYIYRNLHTGGFSIKHRGLVIDRNNFFIAKKVIFKVGELGRQRVLKEKRKNVHAYTVAENYVSAKKKDLKSLDKLKIITYNPYTANYFSCDGSKIVSAESVLFYNGKCYLIDK